MCTGVGIAAYASVALSAAAAVTSSVAASNQAKAQQQQAEYQSAVANINADTLSREAVNIEALGANEIADIRRRGGVIKGQQTAAFGSAGVDVGQGSPLDVFADTTDLQEQDVVTAQYGVDTSAYNKRVQATNAANQGSLFGLQAASYNPGATLAGGLLTGAASVGSRGFDLYDAGAFE